MPIRAFRLVLLNPDQLDQWIATAANSGGLEDLDVMVMLSRSGTAGGFPCAATAP